MPIIPPLLAATSTFFTALCVTLLVVADISATALVIAAVLNGVGAVLTGLGTLRQSKRGRKKENA